MGNGGGGDARCEVRAMAAEAQSRRGSKASVDLDAAARRGSKLLEAEALFFARFSQVQLRGTFVRLPRHFEEDERRIRRGENVKNICTDFTIY